MSPRAGACVGVDVGATWVRAACLRSGRLLRARARREPSLPLETLLARLMSRWGLRRADRLVLGSARVWRPSERRALRRRLAPLARRVRVLSDVELAWEACLEGKPGILVVAGTGSIAYGKGPGGRRARAGGLGPLLGDEGSAFWIGRRWLKNLPERRALAFAHRPNPTAAVAALARIVGRRAAFDPRARAILREAAGELVLLAERLARELGFKKPAPVSWWGGMFRDPVFKAAFLRGLSSAGKKLVPRPPARSPEAAAARGQVC